jgi:hypothetical protein
VAEERCGDGAEEVRTVTLCHPAARWWQRKVELAFGVWEGGIHSRWLRGDWGLTMGRGGGGAVSTVDGERG